MDVGVLTELDIETREALLERIEEVAEKLAVGAEEAGPGVAAIHAGAGPSEFVAARAEWLHHVEDLVLGLVNVLPVGVEDYEARVLLTFMVELRRAIEVDLEGHDEGGDVNLVRLKMRDVALRLRRQLVRRSLEVPEEAVKFIFATLGGISVTEIGELLGVSTKTVNAWRNGNAVKTDLARVHAVAEVLLYLRRSMTPRGLILWFAAKHDALGRKTVLELLAAKRPEDLVDIVEYARGGRGQLAD